MALNLSEGNFALNKAPRTLKEAVQLGKPISVISKVTDIESIYNQIEFNLIQSLALLNLNLTIKESQYPFIVRELVDTFPNESIEDFQLCFKNGVVGKYGKIYNVDLSVLATWMGQYLDEKYQYIESQKEPESKELLPDVDYEAFKQKRKMQVAREAEAKSEAFKAERERQLKELEYDSLKANYIPKYNAEDVTMKERIKAARVELYGLNYVDTSKWDFFDVEDQSIFCASLEDAREIYLNAQPDKKK